MKRKKNLSLNVDKISSYVPVYVWDPLDLKTCKIMERIWLQQDGKLKKLWYIICPFSLDHKMFFEKTELLSCIIDMV